MWLGLHRRRRSNQPWNLSGKWTVRRGNSGKQARHGYAVLTEGVNREMPAILSGSVTELGGDPNTWDRSLLALDGDIKECRTGWTSN